MMLSHNGAEARMARRPKSRYKTWGEDLMSASAIPLAKPGGDMAGARAMKTLTWVLSVGWRDSAAKACAVP